MANRGSCWSAARSRRISTSGRCRAYACSKAKASTTRLRRIARQEVGLEIDPRQKVLLGQFVGKFKTEHQRQDLSTGYWVKVSSRQSITLNQSHFSEVRITYTPPRPMGAMYRFYLQRFQELRAQ